MNYISCRCLSVYDTSIEFNHAHDVYKLIACYFEKADVEIKLKKKEKEITQASRKKNKGAPQLQRLVKEKKSLLRMESARQRKQDKCRKKGPLENDTLKPFTGINPVMVTSSNELVLTRLLSLPSVVPNLLNVDDEECCVKEVKAVMVDSNLPSAICMVND